MLAADEDIANAMVEIAQRMGSTVYQTVNDILTLAIRADKMGLSLEEIMKDREILERAKRSGFTFTMERLLYEVVDVASASAGKRVSELWLETGKWYGRFFSDMNKDGVQAFKEAMSLLTFGSAVFSVEKGKGDNISVSCVGEKFTPGFTEMFSLFIEGVFDSLGMKLTAKENHHGSIRLRFTNNR